MVDENISILSENLEETVENDSVELEELVTPKNNEWIMLGIIWLIILGSFIFIWPKFVEYQDKGQLVKNLKDFYIGNTEPLSNFDNKIITQAVTKKMITDIDLAKTTIAEKFATEEKSRNFISMINNAKSIKDTNIAIKKFQTAKVKELKKLATLEKIKLQTIFPIIPYFPTIIETFDKYSLDYSQDNPNDPIIISNIQFGNIMELDTNSYNTLGITMQMQGTKASMLDFFNFIKDTGNLSLSDLIAKYNNLPIKKLAFQSTGSISSILDRNIRSQIFNIKHVTITNPPAASDQTKDNYYKFSINFEMMLRKISDADMAQQKKLFDTKKSELVKKITNIAKNPTYIIAQKSIALAKKALEKKKRRLAYLYYLNAISALNSL